MNVALYGRSCRRWTMTERGETALQRDSTTLGIGPSSLKWTGETLEIGIDELGMPLPRRVRGTIRLYPQVLPGVQFHLDAEATQIWQPIAPSARVEVRMTSPDLSWSGSGYFDHNRGSRPLECAFERWDWSRQSALKATHILYHTTAREGSRDCLALSIDSAGRIDQRLPPPRHGLAPARIWRIARTTLCDDGASARVLETLEDTPFYARSLVETSLWGVRGPSMHESLNLDRFAAPIVQAMLPFRMPRRSRWR